VVGLASGMVLVAQTVTVTDNDGDTASASQLSSIGQNITFLDDTPSVSSFQHGVMGHEAGTLTGAGVLNFGADHEGSINITPLTQIDGVTYTYSYSGGSTTLIATLAATSTTPASEFYTLTVNPDGTYAFHLTTPNPSTTTQVDFSGGGVQGSGSVHSLTLGDVTFTSLKPGDNVKPTSDGFGLDGNGNIDAGEGFTAAFAEAVNGVTITLTSYTKFSFTTSSGDTGTIDTNGVYTIDGHSGTIATDGHHIVLDPSMLSHGSFSSITFTAITASGGDKLDGFSYSHSVLTSDQDLSFNVVATDGDGDTASTTLGVTLEGGFAGGTITGTAGDDSIHGTSSAETIIGGAGNDTLFGGTGADTFVWHLSDRGTTGAPAVDTVKDFDIGSAGVGNHTNGDVLDLTSLLQGHTGDAASYLHIGLNSNGQVQIDVNANGTSTPTATPTQEIVISNLTSLTGLGSGSSDQIIHQMIADGKMKVS
jgi:hypothetical protein